MLTCLIIDDERPNRVLLRALLADHAGSLSLLGEAAGGAEAVRLIDSLRPDLIFLDVQMPDLSGFEVLERIAHRPQVVFVTAYDHYAVKAFDENAVDYLLKPVDERRLARTVAKLQQPATAPAAPWEQLQQQLQAPPRLRSLPVSVGSKILLVPVEEIAWFEADEKYVALHTADGRRHLVDHTLTALEAQLPEQFLRVQKGSIINTNYIAEVQRHFNNRLIIRLKDSKASEVMSGTSYRQAIRERLLF